MKIVPKSYLEKESPARFLYIERGLEVTSPLECDEFRILVNKAPEAFAEADFEETRAILKRANKKNDLAQIAYEKSKEIKNYIARTFLLAGKDIQFRSTIYTVENCIEALDNPASELRRTLIIEWDVCQNQNKSFLGV